MNTTYTVSHDSASSDGELQDPSLKLTFSDSSMEEEPSRTKRKEGNKKKDKNQASPSRHVKRTRLSFADMVVTAVKSNADPKGASLPSIKSYLKEQYLIDEAKLKRYLKQSMEKCLENEAIVRCRSKGAKEVGGMNGRFRFNEAKNKAGGSSTASINTKGVRRRSPKSRPVVINKSKLLSLKRKSTTQTLAMKTLKSARLSLSASSTKGKKSAKSSVKAGKKMAKKRTEIEKSQTKTVEAKDVGTSKKEDKKLDKAPPKSTKEKKKKTISAKDQQKETKQKNVKTTKKATSLKGKRK